MLTVALREAVQNCMGKKVCFSKKNIKILKTGINKYLEKYLNSIKAIFKSHLS